MYLSNTGAKDGEAVRQKLRGAPYRLQTELIPKGLVYTAAEAQCALHVTNPNLPLATYKTRAVRLPCHVDPTYLPITHTHLTYKHSVLLRDTNYVLLTYHWRLTKVCPHGPNP